MFYFFIPYFQPNYNQLIHRKNKSNYLEMPCKPQNRFQKSSQVMSKFAITWFEGLYFSKNLVYLTLVSRKIQGII
jgi:hypothetical protein